MKCIHRMLTGAMINDRFEYIDIMAAQSNPNDWEKIQEDILVSLEKFKKTDPELLCILDAALAAENAMIKVSAYLIGFKDGMAM